MPCPFCTNLALNQNLAGSDPGLSIREPPQLGQEALPPPPRKLPSRGGSAVLGPPEPVPSPAGAVGASGTSPSPSPDPSLAPQPQACSTLSLLALWAEPDLRGVQCPLDCEVCPEWFELGTQTRCTSFHCV